MAMPPRKLQAKEDGFDFLPHPLTDERREEIGSKVGKLTLEIRDCEDSKKAETKVYTDQITEAKRESVELARALRDGVEIKETAVQFIRDFRAGTHVTVRLDTGMVVRTRPLREDEAQIPMPMDRTADES